MELNCGKIPATIPKRPITPPHLRTKENGWCFIDTFRKMPTEEDQKKKTKLT